MSSEVGGEMEMGDVPVLIMINIYTGEVMCWLVELQWSWSPLELYNIDPYHDISDTAQPLTNTLLLLSDKTISQSQLRGSVSSI